MNSENLECINLLKKTKNVDSNNYEQNLEFYTNLAKTYPKSTAIK